MISSRHPDCPWQLQHHQVCVQVPSFPAHPSAFAPKLKKRAESTSPPTPTNNLICFLIKSNLKFLPYGIDTKYQTLTAILCQSGENLYVFLSRQKTTLLPESFKSAIYRYNIRSEMPSRLANCPGTPVDSLSINCIKYRMRCCNFSICIGQTPFRDVHIDEVTPLSKNSKKKQKLILHDGMAARIPAWLATLL